MFSFSILTIIGATYFFFRRLNNYTAKIIKLKAYPHNSRRVAAPTHPDCARLDISSTVATAASCSLHVNTHTRHEPNDIFNVTKHYFSSRSKKYSI